MAAAVEAGVADGDTQAALMRASQIELVGGDDPVAQVDYYLYEALETAGNIVDTNQFAIHIGYVIDAGRLTSGSEGVIPRSWTAMRTFTGWQTRGQCDRADLNDFNADSTVDQVNNLQIFEDGGHDVVDSAGPIEGNIAAIDDADQVFGGRADTIVAEHEALDDEDTTPSSATALKTRPRTSWPRSRHRVTGSSTVAGATQPGDEDLHFGR